MIGPFVLRGDYEDLLRVCLCLQRRADELEKRCAEYDKLFESIRVRLSQPTKEELAVPVPSREAWPDLRARLTAKYAGSDVMITPNGN